MTTLDPALIIIGFFMPVLVALIKQADFSQQVNNAIAFAVYIIAAVIWMLLQKIPLTLEAFAQNAAALTVVGLAAYKMFWDAIGTGDSSIDKTLTSATSIVRPPV